MSTSNKCEEIAELLDAYHDNELDSADILLVEQHTAECAACARRLKEIATVVAGLKSMPKIKLKKEIDFAFLEPLSSSQSGASSLNPADSCKPFFEMLDAFNDSELSPDESLGLSKHLSDCASCNQNLAQIKQLTIDLSALPRMSPSRDILASLDFSNLSLADLNTPACDDIAELLDAYHDGELTAKEKSFVDKHLSLCDECPPKLREIRQLVAKVKSLPKVQSKENIIDKMDFGSKPDLKVAESTKSNVLNFSRNAKVWFSAAAAVAAIALIFGLSIKPTEVAVVNPNSNGAIQTKAPLKQPEPQIEKEDTTNVVPETASNVENEGAIQSKLNDGIGKEEKSDSSAKKVELAALPVEYPSTLPTKHEVINLDMQNKADKAEIAIMPENENGACADALGVRTDEDGLYEIKI